MDEFTKKLREIVVTKEKLAYAEKVTDKFLTEMISTVGREDEDFIKEMATLQFSSFFLAHQNSKQVVSVKLPRQSFWDWLWNKPTYTNITVECLEILHNPGKHLPPGQSTFIYKAEEYKLLTDEED